MEILICMVVTLALSLLLRDAIKAVPWVFYVIAIAAVILHQTHALFTWWRAGALFLFPYMSRCLFGICLFIIVMYLGIFSVNNKFRKRLMPIRGELSIIASIFVAGHIANYIAPYIQTAMHGIANLSGNLIAGFIVAFALVLLLIPLAITSFKAIRNKMKPASWRKLQKWAYLFYALVYVHLCLLLAPSAFQGGRQAIISLVFYTVVFVVYAILRVRRAMVDKKETEA